MKNIAKIFVFFLSAVLIGSEIKNNNKIKEENAISSNKSLIEHSVVNSLLGGIPQEKISEDLDNDNKDIAIEIDGKYRLDSSYSNNTRFLNNKNGDLDATFIPGKHSIDLGFGISYGEDRYDKKVVELGIDLRNRIVWGKPDDVATTTKSILKEGPYLFGSHSHSIGVPVMYVRGVSLTIDLATLYGSSVCNTSHSIQMGQFPFQVGNGISLGSAYAVTPDFISYDPSNVIQEYAPGILLNGEFINEKLYYKSYIGILSNKSSTFNDVNEKIRSQQFGKKLNPARGFGVINFIYAGQLDWKTKLNGRSFELSPYVVLAHEGEEIVEFVGDAYGDVATLGFLLTCGCPKSDISFSFECAKNIGEQHVFGIDRNIISREMRNEIPSLMGSSVLVNSHVLYKGLNDKNDLKNRKAIFLDEETSRQSDIASVFQNASSNSQEINNTLSNASDRFRNCYVNSLRGFMGVFDVTWKIKGISCYPIVASIALGYASGDDNPNKSLEATDDYMQDSVYNGFIGFQEIYSGKAVKSVFLMSGAGKIPRILSVPGRSLDNLGVEKSLGYPSVVSRFTNLAYAGISLAWKFDSVNFQYKINPNIISYLQPKAAFIYDKILAKRIDKRQIASHLGVEFNLFVEIIPENIDGVKFFGAASLFVPGSAYGDLKGLPLSKEQQKFLDSSSFGVSEVEFVPTMGTNNAFYLTYGLEYKF